MDLLLCTDEYHQVIRCYDPLHISADLRSSASGKKARKSNIRALRSSAIPAYIFGSFAAGDFAFGDSPSPSPAFLAISLVVFL